MEQETAKNQEAKGDCFIVHGAFMINPFDDETKEYTLVHAEVSGQQELEGVRFAHAWLEKDDVVIDLSNDREIIIPKDLYYALACVIQEPGKYARYTDAETCKKLLVEKNWGPWDLNCEL